MFHKSSPISSNSDYGVSRDKLSCFDPHPRIKSSLSYSASLLQLPLSFYSSGRARKMNSASKKRKENDPFFARYPNPGRRREIYFHGGSSWLMSSRLCCDARQIAVRFLFARLNAGNTRRGWKFRKRIGDDQLEIKG